ARQKVVAATDAMIEQKGVMSDSTIADKLTVISAAYEKVASGAMKSTGAAKMFGGDMVELTTKILTQAGVSEEALAKAGGSLTKLIALAKENKIELPVGFT